MKMKSTHLIPNALYRGKDKNGEWRVGSCLVRYNFWHPCAEDTKAYIVSQSGKFRIWRVNPDTIDLGIMMRDKFDNEAFTGDITEDQNGKRWVICDFLPEGFRLIPAEDYLHKWNSASMKSLSDSQTEFWHNHKIIGNIEDNLDLLPE